MKNPKEFTKRLIEGICMGNYILKASKVEQGRFVEEENLTLTLNGKRVMFIKVFYGRKPHYKEWAELFNIESSFFSSCVEDSLYLLLSEHFRRVFVEYYTDQVTAEELRKGLPVEKTRLGKKLKSVGYRYFKDWYYPEGWMEGSYKIQAEF